MKYFMILNNQVYFWNNGYNREYDWLDCDLPIPAGSIVFKNDKWYEVKKARKKYYPVKYVDKGCYFSCLQDISKLKRKNIYESKHYTEGNRLLQIVKGVKVYKQFSELEENDLNSIKCKDFYPMVEKTNLNADISGWIDPVADYIENKGRAEEKENEMKEEKRFFDEEMLKLIKGYIIEAQGTADRYNKAIAELEKEFKKRETEKKKEVKPLTIEEAGKMFPVLTLLDIDNNIEESTCSLCKEKIHCPKLDFKELRQYLYICQKCVEKWRQQNEN